MKRESRAPLIVAIVLLLLPVLYVGSYLAVVSPEPIGVTVPAGMPLVLRHYRVAPDLAERFYWPLEQVDRKVRRKAWLDDLFYRPTLSPSPPKQNTPSGGFLNDPRAKVIEDSLGGDF